MAGFIEMDDRELRKLEVDLSESKLRVQFGATKTLRRSASRVDLAMREDASGHRYLPNLPNAVSHELLDSLTAEIGLAPDGDQGSLAHIIAYGSVNNAPVYDHTAGLRRWTPWILNQFGEMAEKSVLGERE